MFNQSENRRVRRKGLTLVEMMISVALTLMVVFALVRVFEALGSNVTDSRAAIEMSGNLRSAANILRRDLAGLTVTTLPPRAPEQGEGYFEISDGPATDSQQIIHASDGSVTPPVNLGSLAVVDPDGDGFLPGSGFDTSVGDVDDILAFTSRRLDEPFIGTISDGRVLKNGVSLIPSVRAPTLTLRSNEAEIVWWVQVERNLSSDAPPAGTSTVDMLTGMTVTQQLNDAISAVPGQEGVSGEPTRALSAQRYPNFVEANGVSLAGSPVRSLHRRVLLIRPDLDLSHVVLNGLDEVAEFLSNNDISVRVLRQSGNVWGVAPNTLADLSKRRFRAYRLSMRWPESHKNHHNPKASMIHDKRYGQMLAANSYLLRHGAMKNMVLDFKQYDANTGRGVGDGSNEVIMLRRGKDVVLSDVLGFDVQVWDPETIVPVSGDLSTTVTPSDPGYVSMITNYASNPASVPAMTGAYVDLGYAVPPKMPAPLAATLQGQFGGDTHPKSLMPIVFSTSESGAATYCTWSTDYEYDGFDQDGINGIDQGNNGIDDPDPTVSAPEKRVYGVDDPGEAETSPPYPHPLRGVKVSLRIMDFTTRQVRQTSVTTDFVNE